MATSQLHDEQAELANEALCRLFAEMQWSPDPAWTDEQKRDAVLGRVTGMLCFVCGLWAGVHGREGGQASILARQMLLLLTLWSRGEFSFAGGFASQMVAMMNGVACRVMNGVNHNGTRLKLLVVRMAADPAPLPPNIPNHPN